MKPFTIFQDQNAPIVPFDSFLKIYSANDGSTNGAQSGLNALLQGILNANKRFVVINTGLLWTPASDFVAWALVAESDTSPNPNNVRASIQFQTDSEQILF